jgi:hypothetical protein
LLNFLVIKNQGSVIENLKEKINFQEKSIFKRNQFSREINFQEKSIFKRNQFSREINFQEKSIELKDKEIKHLNSGMIDNLYNFFANITRIYADIF